VAARYVHANSNRADAPFITVNCAGVEPDRMEEVLFGREGKDQGVQPGLLEQANGGVIYFDEVADMPLGTQGKILRVLVDQQFTRVGGSDKVRVDLRVISSTSRDLEAEIAADRFRQELFHRLNVVPIPVPSLEERREDIPLLGAHFIAECNKSQGLAARTFSDEAAALMQTMVWPGNVRQLKPCRCAKHEKRLSASICSRRSIALAVIFRARQTSLAWSVQRCIASLNRLAL